MFPVRFHFRLSRPGLRAEGPGPKKPWLTLDADCRKPKSHRKKYYQFARGKYGAVRRRETQESCERASERARIRQKRIIAGVRVQCNAREKLKNTKVVFCNQLPEPALPEAHLRGRSLAISGDGSGLAPAIKKLIRPIDSFSSHLSRHLLLQGATSV
jgi:hypothetical protein